MVNKLTETLHILRHLIADKIYKLISMFRVTVDEIRNEMFEGSLIFYPKDRCNKFLLKENIWRR